jgi:hypothetical protein
VNQPANGRYFEHQSTSGGFISVNESALDSIVATDKDVDFGQGGARAAVPDAVHRSSRAAVVKVQILSAPSGPPDASFAPLPPLQIRTV